MQEEKKRALAATGVNTLERCQKNLKLLYGCGFGKELF